MPLFKKPRIRLLPDRTGTWECRSDDVYWHANRYHAAERRPVWGHGYTPERAYLSFQRNMQKRLRCPQ